MSTISELKKRSIAQLGGNVFSEKWLTLAAIGLVINLILSMLGFTVIGTLIVTGPIDYALIRIYLNTANGKSFQIEDAICGFKESLARNVLLGIMRELFVFLWGLLFVIPGIVVGYSYAMATYIAHEDKELTWDECLKKSKEMMYGNKMKLFLLDLSFLGWYILGSLVFGLGALLVMPYHQMTRLNFFEELNGKAGVKVEPENQKTINVEC